MAMDEALKRHIIDNRHKYRNLSMQLGKLWKKWSDIRNGIDWKDYPELCDQLQTMLFSIQGAMFKLDKDMFEAGADVNMIGKDPIF